SEITAPIKQGQELGLMKIHLDDELLIEEPLVAIQSVSEGSLVDRALDSIKLLFK
ncbi:MAG: D-alanyl-D-alanine carboxypeptidase (penicillin-binding protein 5/6), partial [Gammaproteobacteria bacterium]